MNEKNIHKIPLTLCMIVKNEEKNLSRALKSVQDYVSEIIIVDTGSTDQTVKVARAFGAKVFCLTWSDNFSKARNFALSKTKTKWALVLDADEELIVDSPFVLKEILKNRKTTGYLIPTLNYTEESMNPNIETSLGLRIFNSKYRYKGSIHEQIILPKGKTPRIVEKGLYIKHFGYLKDQTIARAKTNRNIGILNKELANDPENPFYLFYLGNEYLNLGLLEKALNNYYKAELEPALVTFYSPLLKKVVFSLTELGEKEEALNWIEKGLRHYPNFTDLYYLRGQIKHQQQNYPEAIKNFKKCLEIGEAEIIYTSTKGVGSYKALYSLGIIYEELKEIKQAEEAFLSALKLNPYYYYPIYNLILLKSEEGAIKLEKYLDTYFDLADEKTVNIIVNVLKELNQYKLISNLVEDLRKHQSIDDSFLYKLGVSYFYCSNPKKSLSVLKTLSPYSKYYNSSSKYLILNHMILGHNKKIQEYQKSLEKQASCNDKILLEFLKLIQNQQDKLMTCKLKNNLNLGLSLLQDLLIIKWYEKSSLLTKALIDLQPEATFIKTLALLHFRYGYKEESFRLLTECLKKEYIDQELLSMLMELIKEETYLKGFSEVIRKVKASPIRVIFLSPKYISPVLGRIM